MKWNIVRKRRLGDTLGTHIYAMRSICNNQQILSSFKHLLFDRLIEYKNLLPSNNNECYTLCEKWECVCIAIWVQKTPLFPYTWKMYIFCAFIIKLHVNFFNFFNWLPLFLSVSVHLYFLSLFLYSKYLRKWRFNQSSR